MRRHLLLRAETMIGWLSAATIVGCGFCVIATVLVGMVPTWRSSVVAAAIPLASYRVGDAIDIDPALYAGRDRTVVVFADASCSASQRSLAALTTLVRTASNFESGVVLLMGGAPETAPANQVFASVVGIRGADVHTLDLKRLRLRRVPAIAVVNRSGVLLAYHEGRLGAVDADALMEKVGGLVPASPAS